MTFGGVQFSTNEWVGLGPNDHVTQEKRSLLLWFGYAVRMNTVILKMWLTHNL